MSTKVQSTLPQRKQWRALQLFNSQKTKALGKGDIHKVGKGIDNIKPFHRINKSDPVR